MRAVAVAIGESAGVAGFIVPGDRVDVYLTRDPGEIGLPYTDQLIQGARVLAVGQDNNVSKEKPEVVRTATIEVTPQQAQKIALAQSVGSLSLSLRNILDDTRQPLQTAQLFDLNDGTVTRIVPRPKVQGSDTPPAAPAATAAAPRPRLMEIFRGAKSSASSEAN
jgi:pilus assembly protein CpaB